MQYLFISEISELNEKRCNRWHTNGIDEWSPQEWACAFAGEAGELCNVLKKLLRHDLKSERARPQERQKIIDAAAQEIGDTYIYLDLLCQRLGLDMYSCIRDTFNRVSEREGFPEKF